MHDIIILSYNMIYYIIDTVIKMSSLANMKRLTFTNDMVMDIIELYQFKGKDFYYNNIFKTDADSITKQTIYDDVVFFLALYEIEINPRRLKLLLSKGSTPKTKEEQLAVNMQQIFTICCDSVRDFDLKANQILSTVKLMFREIKNMTFGFSEKIVQNGILREKVKQSKREDISNLFEDYSSLLGNREYELTYLVTNFYIDFLNIKPFDLNNEMVSTLLIYILLFKEGFTVFKYDSFFKLLWEEKESFKQYTLQANYNWNEGFSHTEPLTQLLIKLLIKGYRNIESFVRNYEYESKINKSDNIENTIGKLPQTFSKEDIRERHPYVSDSTINRTLQRLRDEGKVRPLGVGRSARWIRTKESPEQFNINGQLDIFAFDTFQD